MEPASLFQRPETHRMTEVAWPISKLRVVPTPGPSALNRSKHESRDVVVREQPFALPEMEDLGARGVTQQPKGAFSLGSAFIVHRVVKLAGPRVVDHTTVVVLLLLHIDVLLDAGHRTLHRHSWCG